MKPEFSLQTFAVDLLRLGAAPKVIWFHCPNGEARSPRTGARLKRMGVRPGVPDLCFVLPGGQSAFLELKSGSGHLTQAQRQFRDAAADAGAKYAVANNPDGVTTVLREWGALR